MEAPLPSMSESMGVYFGGGCPTVTPIANPLSGMKMSTVTLADTQRTTPTVPHSRN